MVFRSSGNAILHLDDVVMMPVQKVATDGLRHPGHRREILTGAVALVALFNREVGPAAAIILKWALATFFDHLAVMTVRYRLHFRSRERKPRSYVPCSWKPD